VREIFVDLLAAKEREERLGRAPGVQREGAPQLNDHSNIRIRNDLMDIDPTVPGADRECDRLVGLTGQVVHRSSREIPNIDVHEVGDAETQNRWTELVTSRPLLELHIVGAPERRQDAVDTGLGHTEVTGDLRDAKGLRFRGSEQVQDGNGTLYRVQAFAISVVAG
jgi:hypothetical protein